ncbi:hypothetical protein AB0C77_30090 [Streptomyces sp. NPDC048629]|uniref:hypothetical protein n=1 Tax=Streptomyces sp. NPDC048629 TaxID=3154824 RepID=UPI00341F8640
MLLVAASAHEVGYDGLGATAVVTPTGGHFGATPDDHVEVPEAVRLIAELLPERAD